MKTPRGLLNVFRNIAEGKTHASHTRNFGHLVHNAIQAGLITKDDVAAMLNVQPHQVTRKANGLEPRKIEEFSTQLLNHVNGQRTPREP